MNLANMSPAERMKAFGLVGLIIVVLFFAVHTLLGSVKPPKQNPPPGANGTAMPGPPPPVGGGPLATAQQPPTSGLDAFPLDKAKESARHTNAEVDRTVPDPFVQINDPYAKNHAKTAANDSIKHDDHDVKIESMGSGAPKGTLPGFGSMGMGGGSAMGGGAGLAPMNVTPIDPEIRVIGIVKGDAPIATISVGGTVQIARPGDPIAKGYRLMQVTDEGVVIKHRLESMTLRVGAAVNSPVAKQ